MLVCWWWWFDWKELCATYSSIVTTTSIILCFNKHRLTRFTWKMAIKTERERERMKKIMKIGLHLSKLSWKLEGLCALWRCSSVPPCTLSMWINKRSGKMLFIMGLATVHPDTPPHTHMYAYVHSFIHTYTMTHSLQYLRHCTTLRHR